MSTLLENYERMNHEALYRDDLHEDEHPHGIVAPGDFEDSPLDQLRELPAPDRGDGALGSQRGRTQPLSVKTWL